MHICSIINDPQSPIPDPQSPIPSPRRSRNPFKNLFLTARPFWVLLGLAAAFVAAFVWAPLLPVAEAAAFALAVLAVADLVLLWGTGGAIAGQREVPEKLSLGDPNEIAVVVRSRYGFCVSARVIDEVPVHVFEVPAWIVTSSSIVEDCKVVEPSRDGSMGQTSSGRFRC